MNRFEKNKTLAQRYYERALSFQACDYEKYVLSLFSAANCGCLLSMALLEEEIWTEDPSDEDLHDFLELLGKYANAGNASAQYFLAERLLKSGDEELAFEWYSSAADNGFVLAYEQLSSFYRWGRAGLRVDDLKADKLLELSERSAHEEGDDKGFLITFDVIL